MGAYELTEDELSATEIQNTRVLMIENIGPDGANNPSYVELTLAEPRLEVNGFADPVNLVDLKISINYGAFESHPNLDRVIRNEGTFIFRTNSFLLDASALRRVANSRNLVRVQALYADGSTVDAQQDFLVFFDCREVENRHCSYTGGQIADVSVSYAGDFIWYEMGNVAPTAFTLTLTYKAWGNLYVGCSAGIARPDCEFQNLSYRINDGEIVTLNSLELAGYQDADGNYVVDIPVSGLQPGLNGVVFGSLYGDTWLRTDVMHFEVQ